MPEQTLFCGLGLVGDDLEVKKNLFLTISKGIIQDIEVEIPNKKGKIQYPDSLLIPGFINAHVHIGDSFAKDRGLNCSIQELVEPPNGLKHQLLNEVSDEVIKLGFNYAIQEMIASGTTTFVDFRESGEKGIEILKEVLINNPINAVICGRPFPTLNVLPKILELCEGIGLSSSNLYSKADLDIIRETCKNQNKLILTHASETQEEKSYASHRFQMSDTKRAVELLDADVLIHITWADAEDVQTIAEHGKKVVICPRSNSQLSVGYPPIDLLKKYKVLTCLGTDNVMINNLNLFREMEFLFKSVREKYGINELSSYEILKMVTVNPAKSLNLNTEIGSIGVGKRADFSLIDLKAPNLRPFTSIYDALVLRANPLNIQTVFIGGKIAYAR